MPAALGLFLLLSSAGCSFLTGVERSYASNRECLEDVARTAGYEIDPQLFRLTAAEVREDSLTLQYRGTLHVGDTAWVVRFSGKSTEQNPAALQEIWAIIPVLAEGRSGFSVVEEGSRPVEGRDVRFVRYRFESAVRDDAARPLPGQGILTTISKETPRGDLVVYHVKLDNHGDRDEVRWEDIAPFLEPLIRD